MRRLHGTLPCNLCSTVDIPRSTIVTCVDLTGSRRDRVEELIEDITCKVDRFVLTLFSTKALRPPIQPRDREAHFWYNNCHQPNSCLRELKKGHTTIALNHAYSVKMNETKNKYACFVRADSFFVHKSALQAVGWVQPKLLTITFSAHVSHP